MNAATRKKLLKLIEAGHAPEGAADSLNLDISVVNEEELRSEIDNALRVGTARLRSKVMELALEGGDVRALQIMLERREAVETADTGITRIERVILNGRCRLCEHRSGMPIEDIGTKELARRLAYLIANGAEIERKEKAELPKTQDSGSEIPEGPTPGNGADTDELNGHRPTITNLYNPYRSYR